MPHFKGIPARVNEKRTGYKSGGNESYRFRHGSSKAKARIKTREQTREAAAKEAIDQLL